MRFEARSVLIEPLSTHRDRKTFFRGNELLDRYMREQAGQDARRGTTWAFIAGTSDQPQRILGFYTLSAASVVAAELPLALAR
ncbi:Putative acetyltransferase (GNAT-family protein) (fragment) [Rhodospirillaceae bacterium LM-1]